VRFFPKGFVFSRAIHSLRVERSFFFPLAAWPTPPAARASKTETKRKKEKRRKLPYMEGSPRSAKRRGLSL
jgi:hypothetical protein